MLLFLRKWSFGGSATLLTFFFCSAALAEVDLEWRPASTIMDVGDQVRLGLYAVSTTGGDQPILAIEVILEWDPVSIGFLGLVNDGPYGWLSSELPDDSMLDGLNDSLTDGDAYYRAFAQFGSPAIATPEGLLVASFDFGAVLPDADTTVAILASAGSYTETAVWDAESAGHDIVGTLGTAHLTIHGCLNNSECSDGNECTKDVCDAGVCSNPPEPVGTACGDASDTECDNPDTCDGSGSCLDNHEPVMTECRADAGDCDVAEYCDGAGSCPEDGYEPPGTLCGIPLNDCTSLTCDGGGTCGLVNLPPGAPCGDPTDTVCDNPDSCDGNGTCLDNYEQQGTPCLDELFCNGEEACDGGGVCQAGTEPCTDPLLPFCDEETDACVECLRIGDVDGDDDVNLQDFAAFAGVEGCQTGPGGPVDPPMYAPECRCLDADDDGDIDLVDFGYFQRSFSG